MQRLLLANNFGGFVEFCNVRSCIVPPFFRIEGSLFCGSDDVCWSDDKNSFNLAVVFEGVGGQDKILVGHLHGVFEEEEVLVGVVTTYFTDKYIGGVNDFSPSLVISNV